MKRTEDKITNLIHRVNKLEEDNTMLLNEAWWLRNPPKYNTGDFAFRLHGGTFHKIEILGCCNCFYRETPNVQDNMYAYKYCEEKSNRNHSILPDVCERDIISIDSIKETLKK